MTENIYHIMCSLLQNYKKKIYTHTNILPKKLFFNKRSTKLHLSLDFRHILSIRLKLDRCPKYS